MLVRLLSALVLIPFLLFIAVESICLFSYVVHL